jgi:hypothetical protein
VAHILGRSSAGLIKLQERMSVGVQYRGQVATMKDEKSERGDESLRGTSTCLQAITATACPPDSAVLALDNDGYGVEEVRLSARVLVD